MQKNILILGHSYATQFIDVYNQYTRLFDKNKYHVTIAYLTGAPQPDVLSRTLADEVLFLHAPKSSIRGLKIGQIRQLLALCKSRQFDMVICHRYKPAYIMMWVAQFFPIPTLVMVMHELNTMTSIKRKLLIACLYRKNMLFAGVSDAVRDDLRRTLWRVPTNRMVTLYNVIDVDLTEPQLYSREEARSLLHLHRDHYLFGNIARLVPNKDQKTLIAAFALIKSDCPHAKLIIIGNGILETELKEQVKAAGLDNDVIFTGYLPLGFRYMKALDGFVLSSQQGAFGRVLLEAMIARIPIIATAANGIPEVVGNAGTIIPIGDVQQLASAMKKLYQLTSSERESIANQAYEHLLKHFSIPVFQQQFWTVTATEE